MERIYIQCEQNWEFQLFKLMVQYYLCGLRNELIVQTNCRLFKNACSSNVWFWLLAVYV